MSNTSSKDPRDNPLGYLGVVESLLELGWDEGRIREEVIRAYCVTCWQSTYAIDLDAVRQMLDIQLSHLDDIILDALCDIDLAPMDDSPAGGEDLN